MVGKLKQEKKPIQHFFSLKDELYPYLLVNLRGGANFVRVDSKNEFHRIAGSTIGIHAIIGILRSLNIFEDPIDALTGALVGDSSNIDLSVGDIYGGGCDALGMPSDWIASSFGKITNTSNARKTLNKNDIARSLLSMVTVNTLIYSKQIA